jgi:hypothetical protein
MSTVLVALTVLDGSADGLLDALAASFPISAFRGSPGVWLVEVDQDGEASVDHAEHRIDEALSAISEGWRDALRIGATRGRMQAE